MLKPAEAPARQEDHAPLCGVGFVTHEGMWACNREREHVGCHAHFLRGEIILPHGF